VRNLKLIIIFWLASFAMPGISFALGLGEINVSSFLNQPLKAEIAVISARPGEIDNLGVRLASIESFARAGLSRPSHLTDLSFEVKKGESGDQAIILVTSKNIVKEPFLNFLVEADWSKGKVLREFTILLDPPFFDDSQSSDSVIAATIEDEVAPIASPEVAPIASPDVVNTTEVNAASVTASDISNANPDSVVVVKGNSLWSIASQFKDSGHSMAQVMLAMQRANLDAFSNNNINNLKVGAVFRAPTADELDQLNKQEAYAQVLEQHGLWDKNGGKVIEPPVSIANGGVSNDSAQIKQNSSDDFSLLTLGSSDSELAGQAEGGDESSALKNQLALAEEQLDASQIEKQEMQSRIADLEARLSKFDELQKMLEIEDDSLAQLQADQTNDLLAEDGSQNKSTAISVEVTELAEGSLDKDLSLLHRILPLGIINLIPSMSWFFSNPIAFGGLSGLVILLLGLFLYRRRKNSEDDGETGITLSDVDLDESPSSNDDMRRINLAQKATDADDKSLSANSMSQVSKTNQTQEATLSALPTEQDDLLNEVDVYLAYGLYDNAEELLAQSLEANPDRIDYRAKLLDTYFATKNIDGFFKEAALLKSNGRSADRYWGKVQVMGYELAPDNELFSAGKESGVRPDDLEIINPEMTDFEAGVSEDDSDDLSNTDFNLDEDINEFDDVQPLQADADTLSLPDAAELETLEFTLDVDKEDDGFDDVRSTNLGPFVDDSKGPESNDLKDIPLDFDLDEAEDLPSESDSGLYIAEGGLELTEDIKDPIEKNINLSQSVDEINLDADDISLIGAQGVDEDFQFDLDESDEALDSDSLGLDDIDNSDETTLPQEFDIHDIGDLMLPDDVDEVATKLDLARAFIDMGDAEGARDSLEEVLAEGTSEQRAEAAQLLENM
jgi:pilus assembly protein FimV